jgi:hypothetical protein
MAKARSKRPRRLRREALVFQHLERVSRELLVRHPDIVRQFIGRNAGVYAPTELTKGASATLALEHPLVNQVLRDFANPVAER